MKLKIAILSTAVVILIGVVIGVLTTKPTPQEVADICQEFTRRMDGLYQMGSDMRMSMEDAITKAPAHCCVSNCY